eukprot:TRINITY_DN2259_c0_g1_i3.p2 TRINITY_DN2259_c0_g1~~TRINITY_DN2259_c0_g1_i3.p2  ORF type:complete len:279 (+),score=118.15 TRINITY_DN2259_c0_g1_i3:33-839(+)
MGAQEKNVYESLKSLHEYLLFHYATDEELLAYEFGPKDSLHFPKRIAHCAATKAAAYAPRVAQKFDRALDIGCAVGRTSFELARFYSSVVGIDFSHSFVDACNQLKSTGRLSYSRVDEGDIVSELKANVAIDIDRTRVSFEQGDACNLRADLGSFDLVMAANLVCRLPEPRKFLARLPALVKPGGMLFLATPFTWMEQFTPKSEWLGGYYDKDGKAVRSFDTLQTILSPDFELLESFDMDFFIREHSRKNQWSVTLISLWVRKSSPAQ